MFLKKCFIKIIDFSTIETRRQSYFKKKRKHPFNSDNSKKIVKSFKSRHWNEKLNSINRKQKKKIKDDRNRITATKTEFKKKTFFKSARIRKSRSEIQKIEIAREVVSKRRFQKINHKRQSEVRLNSRDFIAFFTKQHAELIMSEEEAIRDEVDERRMKICATHERVETIIVVESMTHL